MLEMGYNRILEIQWLFSLSLFFILALLHEYAGYQAYIKGRDLNIFRKNGNWKPNSGKEYTLLGVFFMISFAWIGTILFTTLLLLTENPLGIWLGIIYLFSILPQYILLEIYVKWNKVARGVVILNIVSTILWMIPRVL